MAINHEGREYTPGKCFACRARLHEDEDDDIEMCVIIDPDTHKLVGRGRLCGAHQDMYLCDGYLLK